MKQILIFFKYMNYDFYIKRKRKEITYSDLVSLLSKCYY